MTLRRTKLAPISAKRLAEFQALGIHPASTFKPSSKPTAAKRWTDTGPDDATVMVVLKRDEWKCACCGDRLYGDRGSGWCIAHRKLRAQGVDNRPANLYASCLGCERETHRGPERARQAGWMLKSTEDPQAVPMEHAVHGYGQPFNDGTWRRAVPSMEGAVE